MGWINTAGPLRTEDLRGKFVILDFWTYCCINCLQLLPELKKLEHKYPRELVVIGVHSAKFDGEQQTQNIAEAVQRYEIEHPVVNDAKHEIWDRFGVTAWPTMMIIDPEGYLVATHSGEIDMATLDQFFMSIMPYYQRRKLMNDKPLRVEVGRTELAAGPLRFPGKVLADEASQRLIVTDSGHNRIVLAKLDGKVSDVVGSGQPGATDGDFTTARFSHPQGTALAGDSLYVADTHNHLIRRIDLKTKKVHTVAGTGKQGRGFWPGFDQIQEDAFTGQPKFPDKWQGAPLKTRLASPWALAVHEGWLYIAMAGEHQIWRMSLDEKQIEVFAGDGREDIRDGKRVPPAPPRINPLGFDFGFASFAQPSGLASDGKWLYVADSEGSAVRAISLDADKPVQTIVGAVDLPRGRALFSFGDRDGVGDEVRLQHALGIACHAGTLYVADTYNNKIKAIDRETRTARTLSGTGKASTQDEPAEFDEPAGISYAAGKLYVADTNNHLIRTIDIAAPHKVRTLSLAGLAPPPIEERPTNVFEGSPQKSVPAITRSTLDNKLRLKLRLALPSGWKTNPLGPMKYRLSVEGDAGVVDAASLNRVIQVPADQRQTELAVDLPTQAARGKVDLRIALAYFYCQDKTGVCKAGSVVWLVPVQVTPDGPAGEVLLEHEVEP
ncbi:MAG: redoxin domain-containing protein [Planctomycetes bacterium]|nr:redoxin domain-containing protein [Planctomycetota bacterium]